jgi:hypothetical protein
MAEHPLVERVARGMCRANGTGPDETVLSGVVRWVAYAPCARAAIRAVLTWEPTEEAQRIGNRAAETCVNDDPCGKAGKHVWGDMAAALLRDIDAAALHLAPTQTSIDNI